MTLTDPIITNILCIVGMVLVAVAGAMPIIQGLRRKRTPAPEPAPELETDPASIDYTPPALNREDESSAQGAALVLAALKYPARVQKIHDILLANIDLLREVNDHRTARGIPPRPVYNNKP